MFTIGTIVTLLVVFRQPLMLAARLVLCAGTAYGIYKIMNPSTFILTDMTLWDNAILKGFLNGSWVLFLGTMALSWVVFYWIFYVLLSRLTERTMERFYRSAIAKLPDRLFFALVVRMTRKVMKWIISKGIVSPNDIQEEDEDDISVEDFTSSVFGTSCFFLHATFCWIILGLGVYVPTLIWIIVVAILLLFAIFFVPAVKICLKFIVQAGVHEARLARVT